MTPLSDPTPQPSDQFQELSAPNSKTTPTTVVTEDHIKTVQKFFDRALDELHMVAPTVIFTQMLMPELAKVALSSEEYAEKSPIRPEQLRDFVVSLIFYGPESPQAEAKISEFKKVYDSLDVPLGNRELNFLAYTLTRKLMGALQSYSSVSPTPEDEDAWFRVITFAVEKLGATVITDNYQEFVTENQAIEDALMATPDPLSSKVAKEALELFTKPLPFTLRPFARPAICSILEPQLRHALDLPEISGGKASFYQGVVQKIGKLFNTREQLLG